MPGFLYTYPNNDMGRRGPLTRKEKRQIRKRNKAYDKEQAKHPKTASDAVVKKQRALLKQKVASGEVHVMTQEEVDEEVAEVWDDCRTGYFEDGGELDPEGPITEDLAPIMLQIMESFGIDACEETTEGTLGGVTLWPPGIEGASFSTTSCPQIMILAQSIHMTTTILQCVTNSLSTVIHNTADLEQEILFFVGDDSTVNCGGDLILRNWAEVNLLTNAQLSTAIGTELSAQLTQALEIQMESLQELSKEGLLTSADAQHSITALATFLETESFQSVVNNVANEVVQELVLKQRMEFRLGDRSIVNVGNDCLVTNEAAINSILQVWISTVIDTVAEFSAFTEFYSSMTATQTQDVKGLSTAAWVVMILAVTAVIISLIFASKNNKTLSIALIILLVVVLLPGLYFTLAAAFFWPPFEEPPPTVVPKPEDDINCRWLPPAVVTLPNGDQALGHAVACQDLACSDGYTVLTTMEGLEDGDVVPFPEDGSIPRQECVPSPPPNCTMDGEPEEIVLKDGKEAWCHRIKCQGQLCSQDGCYWVTDEDGNPLAFNDNLPPKQTCEPDPNFDPDELPDGPNEECPLSAIATVQLDGQPVTCWSALDCDSCPGDPHVLSCYKLVDQQGKQIEEWDESQIARQTCAEDFKPT